MVEALDWDSEDLDSITALPQTSCVTLGQVTICLCLNFPSVKWG